MNQNTYDNYLNILKEDLIPALGCTEPIAIAFAAAKAREVLGVMPDSIYVKCSGSIIKNVKGVTVPNSGGLKGINVAATLGIVAGDSSKGLEVLSSVNDDERERAKKIVINDSCKCEGLFCKCSLIEGNENLNIIIDVTKGSETASVEVKYSHTNIVKIIKNSEVIFSVDDNNDSNKSLTNRDMLNVEDIIKFASEVKIDDIKETIGRQIAMNTAISEEGILNEYGAIIGRTLLKHYNKDDVRVKAKAKAAAGSDARMSGCALPVVTNSGSGNQGITVSIPVIEFAKSLKVTEEKLYRALVLSNLIAILQKSHVGKLSAFCGVVCAAAGAGCGIAYLHGYSYKEISETITNTLCTIGGMVCDGAKPSCAAKIAQSVDCAILSFELSSKENQVFKSGDGLVKENIEATIDSIGHMAKKGMASTDIEILNIMIDK